MAALTVTASKKIEDLAMASVKAANMSALLYGTAWKKERTRGLVKQALLAGFRGVDTAVQPKHYREHGVADAIKDGGIRRQDIYLQTKYTPIISQDPHRVPYDPSSSISNQVKASVFLSLKNFASTASSSEDTYLDCLILHTPFASMAQTQEAWRAMESHVPRAARTLGISNVDHVSTLQALYEFAHMKFTVVQNRLDPVDGFYTNIRAFCTEHGIAYQSFWTLTANKELLKSDLVESVASQAEVSKPVAMYGLVIGLGNVSVLDETTTLEHMREDVERVEKIRHWYQANAEPWP